MTFKPSVCTLVSLFSRIGLSLAILPILVLNLYGQSFYGSVVGTISDPSGAALRGAAVTLTNTATGVKNDAQAGASGEYQFLNLVPGNYRVDVELTGFK